MRSTFSFYLLTTLAVFETVCDNRAGQVGISAWSSAVWIAFGAAVCLTAWDLWRMTIGDWQKSHMIVAWLFLVSTTFTLSKSVRDQQEADLMACGSAGAAEPGDGRNVPMVKG